MGGKVGLTSFSGTGGFDSTLQHAVARPEAIRGSLTAAGASVSVVDDKVCVVGGRTSAFQAGGAWESGRRTPVAMALCMSAVAPPGLLALHVQCTEPS